MTDALPQGRHRARLQQAQDAHTALERVPQIINIINLLRAIDRPAPRPHLFFMPLPSTARIDFGRSRTRQWRDNCYREFLPIFLAPDPAGGAR